MNSKVVINQPRRWIAIVATVGVIGVISFQSLSRDQPQQAAPETELTPEPATVTALGRLEPEGEMIRVTAATSAQESRIQALLVEEGDRVQPGQIIAVLANQDTLEATLASAKEQVRIAKARLAQVKAGAKTGELEAQRAEISRLKAEKAGVIASQKATIRRLEAEMENARMEYQRYESLYQQGAISASERDARELTFITTRQQVQVAKSELARLKSTSDEKIQQAKATLEQLAEVRTVDLEFAEAEVVAATTAVRETESRLEKAYIRSPQGGQIIKIHTRPGETIDSEGIVTLGDTQQMIAIAEVYQSDIPAIKVGQPVTITSPVIEEKLQGTVARIGLQVERQQVVDIDPAANTDAKVIEVSIQLDSASREKVAGLSNLQVTVKIITE